MVGSFPRTYREKYWGAIGATVAMVVIFFSVYTERTNPYLIYAYAALFVFEMANLAVTRVVLYEDRIESINLVARRSLRRDEIARLEIRLSPWVICLYVFTSSRFRRPRT